MIFPAMSHFFGVSQPCFRSCTRPATAATRSFAGNQGDGAMVVELELDVETEKEEIVAVRFG